MTVVLDSILTPMGVDVASCQSDIDATVGNVKFTLFDDQKCPIRIIYVCKNYFGVCLVCIICNIFKNIYFLFFLEENLLNALLKKQYNHSTAHIPQNISK